MHTLDRWAVGTFFGGLVAIGFAVGGITCAKHFGGSEWLAADVKNPLGISYRPIWTETGEAADQLTLINMAGRTLEGVVVIVEHPTLGRWARHDLGRVPAEARIVLPGTREEISPEAIVSLSTRERPNVLVISMRRLGKTAALDEVFPRHHRLPGPPRPRPLGSDELPTPDNPPRAATACPSLM